MRTSSELRDIQFQKNAKSPAAGDDGGALFMHSVLLARQRSQSPSLLHTPPILFWIKMPYQSAV